MLVEHLAHIPSPSQTRAHGVLDHFRALVTAAVPADLQPQKKEALQGEIKEPASSGGRTMDLESKPLMPRHSKKWHYVLHMDLL